MAVISDCSTVPGQPSSHEFETEDKLETLETSEMSHFGGQSVVLIRPNSISMMMLTCKWKLGHGLDVVIFLNFAFRAVHFM